MLDALPRLRAHRRTASSRSAACRASELAERFGTPLVVYCEETLRGQARALRAAVGDDGRVFYGTKAFPNVAVLRILREEGIGADVASAGELAFARAAGLTGDELVVHGNNKDDAFLRAGGRGGCARRPRRPGRGGARGGRGRRARARARDARRRRGHARGDRHRPPRLEVRAPARRGAACSSPMRSPASSTSLGLHVHVGSQLPDFTAQAETIRRLAAFARTCRDALGWEARVADLGGGFGIRHHPDDDVPDAVALAATAAATAREAFAAAGLAEPAVWLEPGRCARRPRRRDALPRRCRQAAPRADVGRGRRRHVGQPAAAALRRALHGALSATRADEQPDETVSVAGMHCESGDVLIDDVALPAPRRGDLLAVPATGAYTLAMSSNYNGVGRPAAVLVAGRRGTPDPAPRDRRRPARARDRMRFAFLRRPRRRRLRLDRRGGDDAHVARARCGRKGVARRSGRLARGDRASTRRSASRPVSSSSSTGTTATAPRSRRGSACRTLVAPDELPESPFEFVPIMRRKRWRESALWWPATADARRARTRSGRTASTRAGRRRSASTVLLRLTPPKALGDARAGANPRRPRRGDRRARHASRRFARRSGRAAAGSRASSSACRSPGVTRAPRPTSTT